MLSLIRSHLARGSSRTGMPSQDILVFCYHGLVQTRQDHRLERNFHLLSDFRQHVRWLKGFRVITLSELAAEIAVGGPTARSTAVITFDDGYANNLLAAEILAEANLPWALFVSTNAVGRSKSIWTVELSLLLLHGHSEVLEALGQKWELRTREQRENTFQGIRYPMKAMSASLRQETMRGIRAQFPAAESERLLEQFPAFQMLTWDELRHLAESGVEIGSHGVDHELHHAAQDPEVRRGELIDSKHEIERQWGRPCRFFAFPNGDYCEHSSREVEAASYELAFTTRQTCIQQDSQRFLLPRISPVSPVAKLKRQLKQLG